MNDKLRLQVASDLHLEFLPTSMADETVIRPHPWADMLVLAGDVAVGVDAVRRFARWPVPVLYVPGNHEYYRHDLDHLRQRLRVAALGTSVLLLDNGTIGEEDLRQFEYWHQSWADRLRGVRFLGTTLWTNYRNSRCNASHTEQRAQAQRSLTDHRLITTNGAPFTPDRAEAEHDISVRWLRSELGKPFTGRTVVVTHHAPSERSIHPRFAGSPLNGAFASELPELTGRVPLWIHGHMHDSSDYVENGCRVVANPSGYPIDALYAERVADLRFENARFDPSLLINVP